MRLIIALHRAPGFIGTLIRWQTRSAYSHASLVSDYGVIEAREFHGVRRLDELHRAPGETIDLFNVPSAWPDHCVSAYNFAERQIGKPYDWTMLARFISRRQATRESRGKWFCSELVYAAFHHAGINLLRDTHPWEVSPGLLAKSPLLVPYDPNTLP